MKTQQAGVRVEKLIDALVRKTAPVCAVLALCQVPCLAHVEHEEAQPPLAPESEGTGASRSSLQSRVSISVEGDFRLIRANGLPDHATGAFPNRGNPNRIRAQEYAFRVPANPKPAEKPMPLGMNPFGVAVNGVVFDPGAAEWWRDDRASGWQYEALSGARELGVDANHAHVQPDGAYHYHGLPTGLIEKLTGGKPQVILLGWAADGFPIYGPWGYSAPDDTNSPIVRLKSSYRLKPGERAGGPGGKHDGSFVADYEFVKGAGHLDECNGRFGVTPEFPQGTYYYVLTDNFPFIPRMLKGSPDASFLRRQLAPRPRPPRRPR